MRQLAVFLVPLIVSGLLQIGFNAADMIVVGNFASATSLAAVGATGPLCHLIVTVFVGLSVGANVIVSHFTGAKDPKMASRATHTAIAIAIWCGLALVGVSRFVVEPFLLLMKVPEEVLSLSVLYTLVFCLGIPFSLLYNFGSAILCAVGDTRRPTVYLFCAGILNVVLNLLLVIVFSLDVMGVAIATVMSQMLSAFLVLRALSREPTAEDQNVDTSGIGVRWHLLRVEGRLLKSIVRMGLPAGLQGVFYSGSNMLILSAVASLGGMALAGNAAANTIEGFLYVIGAAFQQAAVSFVGQNFGGKQWGRVRQSVRVTTLGNVILVTAASLVMLWSGHFLLSLYSSDASAINFGLERLRIMFSVYALCPLMEVLGGCLRGLGHSFQPAITTFLGACVLRVLWVLWVFPHWPTMSCVMYSYPISWILVCAVNAIHLRVVLRRLIPLKEGN